MKTLNYMGATDAQQVQQTVSRRLLDLINATPRTEQEEREFEHLQTVLTACETVIEFLNAEHAAFYDSKRKDVSDREVFNTP